MGDLDDRDDLGDLRAAEQALQLAQRTSDVESLDRLLHPDLTFVGPDGAMSDKALDLAVHRSGAMRLDVLEPESLEVRLVDGVGVTVLTARLAGEYDGQSFDGRMRYTRTWALRSAGADVGAVGVDRWRVVAAQAGFVHPSVS